MKQAPYGYTPFEFFKRRFQVDPAVLRAALADGTLASIIHEGELWVNYHRAQVWLAAQPAPPELFAWLNPTAEGKALLSLDSPAETGDDA